MPKKRLSFREWILAVLLLFMALNAFGGGWYGLSGAPGVPVSWLAGSPFHDYRLPSLILILAVGGTSLLGAVAIVANLRWKRTMGWLAGATMMAWIIVQVAIIGYASWMQPTVFIVGAFVVFLSYGLPAPRVR